MTGTAGDSRAGRSRRWQTFCVGSWLLVVAIAVAVRFVQLDVRTLWYDEVASWRTQSFELPQLFRSCRMNVHPPGYFLLLKATVAVLGDGPWVLRGFSGVCSLLALLYAALLVRDQSPNWKGYRAWAATMALAISPLMVLYAREVRMYALGALVALAGSYHALRGLTQRSDRHLIAAALWFALGCYVHNYLLFHAYAFALLLCYQAAGEGQWRWLLYGVLPGVAYLPWIGALMNQAEQVAREYWISWPTWQSVGEMFWQLWCGDLTSRGMAQTVAGYGLTAVALAVALTSGPFGRFAAAQFACAFGFALVLSLWWKPILYTRYLTPAFAVLLAACFCTRVVTPRWDVLGWIPVSWVVILLVASLWRLWPSLTLDGQKGLQGAVQHVRAHRVEGEVVVCGSPFIALPWMYYDRGAEVYLYHPAGHSRLRHYLGKALFRRSEVLSTEQAERKAKSWTGVWDCQSVGMMSLLDERFVLVTEDTRSFQADSMPPSRHLTVLFVQHWKAQPKSAEEGQQERDAAEEGAVEGEGQQRTDGDQPQQPSQRPEARAERGDETDSER